MSEIKTISFKIKEQDLIDFFKSKSNSSNLGEHHLEVMNLKFKDIYIGLEGKDFLEDMLTIKIKGQN